MYKSTSSWFLLSSFAIIVSIASSDDLIFPAIITSAESIIFDTSSNISYNSDHNTFSFYTYIIISRIDRTSNCCLSDSGSLFEAIQNIRSKFTAVSSSSQGILWVRNLISTGFNIPFSTSSNSLQTYLRIKNWNVDRIKVGLKSIYLITNLPEYTSVVTSGYRVRSSLKKILYLCVTLL